MTTAAFLKALFDKILLKDLLTFRSCALNNNFIDDLMLMNNNNDRSKTVDNAAYDEDGNVEDD